MGDKRIEVKVKPAPSKNCTRAQFLNAVSIGFSRYRETIKELSKF